VVVEILSRFGAAVHARDDEPDLLAACLNRQAFGLSKASGALRGGLAQRARVPATNPCGTCDATRAAGTRVVTRAVMPQLALTFGMISPTSRFRSSSVLDTGTPLNGGHSRGMFIPAALNRFRLSVIWAAVPTSRLVNLPFAV
jgi:hypothetical protein